jgi:thiol-disulfide isomerase/thioredoxin
MSDDFANEISPPSKTNWLWSVLIVAAAGLFFAWFLREVQHPVFPQKPHPSVGKQAPPLVAEGWLNGSAPAAAELTGKVYVIEAWAFWCGPCLAAAPHTVELQRKYRDQGVLFIGLTVEGSETLRETRQFLQRAGFTWPSGYGASQTLSELYASREAPIPQVWVVDREGVIVWAGHPLDLKEEFLDALLNSPTNSAGKGR